MFLCLFLDRFDFTTTNVSDENLAKMNPERIPDVVRGLTVFVMSWVQFSAVSHCQKNSRGLETTQPSSLQEDYYILICKIKNLKEAIVSKEKTRIANDEEDWRGLKIMNLSQILSPTKKSSILRKTSEFQLSKK